MKLIANNFTGYLENGNRYNITTKTQFFNSLEKFQLMVNVNEEFEGLDLFMCKESFIEWYWDKESYRIALKKALLKIEEKYQVSLLKSDLKVA